MKVHFDATPEDVIAESIRRKIRTMNVSVEQQQKCVTTHVSSYILKVCGCEEFLLGNHPISQYKVVGLFLLLLAFCPLDVHYSSRFGFWFMILIQA